jgi:hypothetical protein
VVTLRKAASPEDWSLEVIEEDQQLGDAPAPDPGRT